MSAYSTLAPCDDAALARHPALRVTLRDAAGASVALELRPEDYLVGEDCSLAGDGTFFRDCDGVCWPDQSPYTDWDDDGYCDDGASGVNLNCPEHDCDGYQCGSCGPAAASERRTTGEICAVWAGYPSDWEA